MCLINNLLNLSFIPNDNNFILKLILRKNIILNTGWKIFHYVTGEKVDIHIMKNAPAGEWTYLSTEVTDKNGRIIYKIPDDKALGYGLYPVKMVVR